jgi:hypothetical protein
VLQTIFISTGKAALDLAGLQYTLNGAALNNLRNNVTGLILFDEVRFLECLEGEDDIVDAAFERIKQNDLHRGCVLLSRRIIPQRQFQTWNWACRGLQPEASGAGLSMLVDDRVRNVTDLNTQALFSSFARIRP